MFNPKLILLFLGLCLNAVYSSRPLYQVEIKRVVDGNLVRVCDGAIIGKHHVITAAHCVNKETPESLSQLYIESGDDESAYITKSYHRPSKVIYLEDYASNPCRQHEHDIAIVQVHDGYGFNLEAEQHYKKVYLPERDADYEGYGATVSGYGEDEIEQFGVKVISNDDCSKDSSVIVTRGTVCAKFEEAPAIEASGNFSGSPLVTESGAIIGVLNAQSHCGLTNPSIPCTEATKGLRLYTRISQYREFIEHVLDRETYAGAIVVPSQEKSK